MTDKQLSPAAQAVLDEVLYKMCAGESESYAQMIAAAALRGLVNEVMPERLLCTRTVEERTLYNEGRLDAAIRFRAEILAIANELEGK
jgi:hypothetical protein